MKKTIFSVALLGFILSGCSVIGNKVISDNTLKEKAAFAIGTTAENVEISNRRPSEADAIKFDATFKGKRYQCYITTLMGAMSSDAICNTTDGSQLKSGNSAQCNALLKAAGRC
ncbi:MAG: hypothetical protein Q4A84_01235 [Neisseria sp.]|uniref:hypothetical protein n=1 Tax=Neisseria sp. TaxID=192066 RepID=UPI0026DD98F0|nr:hypothetical protein [Neisseria sp.]MDO4640317.1 hypothetical protein [Neisseria sp.]